MILYSQDSVENYFRACKGALFDLTGAPAWLTLSNSSSLVIDAPNNVYIPGKYRFWLSIWEVLLEIEAPCYSNYLKGVTHTGFVSVYIDELVVLDVAFQLDDKKQSWEQSCGYI